MDYALNPYSGCSHGCVYCYAPEVTRSPWEGWRAPRVKSNIVSRLSMELPNVSGVIGIGTVTDPYQPVERKYMLTRRCLEVLKAHSFEIHMHTKSDLILRDLDLLAEMPGTVGLTVTGISERHSKILEPGAPLPARRFSAMRSLKDAGVDVYALVGPVLNHLEGHEVEFVDAVAGTGVGTMYLDPLNDRPLLSARVSRRGYRGSPKALAEIRRLGASVGIRVLDVF
ncbi:MAG: radical SAM protein [Thermoplasmatales archaeon]|nr:radical SAM protein [Thermoplasmatales archaeon]